MTYVRRLLFALLVCLTAWATFAQTGPAPADTSIAMVTVVLPGMDAPEPTGAGDPAHLWISASRGHICLTESLRHASDAQADLATAGSRAVFLASETSGRRHRAVSHRSTHLRNVPLLI